MTRLTNLPGQYGASAARPAASADLGERPQRYSDIEFDRVKGVHGPRRLDVVLVT